MISFLCWFLIVLDLWISCSFLMLFTISHDTKWLWKWYLSVIWWRWPSDHLIILMLLIIYSIKLLASAFSNASEVLLLRILASEPVQFISLPILHKWLLLIKHCGHLQLGSITVWVGPSPFPNSTICLLNLFISLHCIFSLKPLFLQSFLSWRL